jgi:hypothetical protein
MIMFISPAIVAKANALGLESLSDMNGDGHVTMEDVNLCAIKQGISVTPETPVPAPILTQQLVEQSV